VLLKGKRGFFENRKIGGTTVTENNVATYFANATAAEK